MSVQHRRILSMLAVSVTVATLLSGCGASRSKEDQALIDSLQQKNLVLQNENQELRTKVNSQEAVTKMISAFAGKSAPTEHAIAKTEPPAAAQHTFTDLEGLPQKKMIEELAKLGVYDDLTEKFEPFKPVTRGEFVTLLFKAHNKMMPGENQIHLAPQVAAQFKDLKEDHPAYKYAQALANAGYSIGYEDKTFRPDQPITREEMIGIKVGVDCGKTYEPYRSQMAYVWKFSDSGQIDDKFTGYIHQDYYSSGPHGTNIARAFGKVGTFRPKQAVLRSEAGGLLWAFGPFETGTAAKTLAALNGPST